MKIKFEEHACEFKNEADCEEEFDEDVLDIDDAETLNYDE
jgi:hypothetical protein